MLPTQLDVQQSIVLKASPEEVYTLLDNPTQWERWSVRNKLTDPSMIHLYGGPMTGTGARMQWSGDRVGNGQLVFLESTRPSQLTYIQNESSVVKHIQGSFTLAPVAGGTQVVWRQQADIGTNPWARVRGMMEQYRMQEEVNKGLLSLKTLLEDKEQKKAVKTSTAYADHH